MASLNCSILALYRYEQFKEATKSRHEVSSCTIVEPDAGRARQFEQTAELARITCDAMMKVRDLSVGPANFVTPTYLAEQAREIAQKFSLEITVWGKDELRAHGMNAILAVNQGSVDRRGYAAGLRLALEYADHKERGFNLRDRRLLNAKLHAVAPPIC